MRTNRANALLKLLVAVSASVIVLCIGPKSAAAHYTGHDHRTNQSSWFISGGVPSAWTTALVNGALVWDNIQGDSHDFVRYQGPPTNFNVFRGTIDGKGKITANTSDEHKAIKFDSAETWHLNTNATPGNDSLDLWSVAAHEMGHVLHLVHCEIYVQCSYNSNFPHLTPTMVKNILYGTTFARSLYSYDIEHEKALYP